MNILRIKEVYLVNDHKMLHYHREVPYLLSPKTELFSDKMQQLWMAEWQEVHNFSDSTKKLIPAEMCLGSNTRTRQRLSKYWRKKNTSTTTNISAYSKPSCGLCKSINPIFIYLFINFSEFSTFRIGWITDSLNCFEIAMSSLFWISSGRKQSDTSHQQ